MYGVGLADASIDGALLDKPTGVADLVVEEGCSASARLVHNSTWAATAMTVKKGLGAVTVRRMLTARRFVLALHTDR
jgi:hypothetical protein